MNTTQLLTDPDQLPSNELFEVILSKQLLQTYLQIENIISAFGLNTEWRYYHDGKAWLCKITNKKKTIAWLSLWSDCIKTSFYFTEKTREGVMLLDIGNDIKTFFAQAKTIGKLTPLILIIKRPNQADDFKKIAEYKMTLK